jgi:predicted enzyme related to lactoylglutathione lyase
MVELAVLRKLYMVELTVGDWPGAVAWYRDVLGLPVIMRDEANQFALYQAGAGRIALKAGQPEPATVLLTFEVDNLDAELERLARHGVVPEAPIKASPEGYRRAIMRDRDGYRLCLFEWLVSH